MDEMNSRARPSGQAGRASHGAAISVASPPYGDHPSRLSERDLRLLRASVELESQSDLYAAARDLRSATEAMKQANSARRCVFGKLDPNELRERTAIAMETQRAETENTGSVAKP